MRESEAARLGALVILALILLGLLLFGSGCAMVLTEASPPEIRTFVTSQTVDETYARAQRTAVTMGTVLHREDPQAHTFVAIYKQALALHVHVGTVPEGTRLTVTGSVLPQKIGYGLLTEVDDYVALYRQTP